MLNKKLIVLNTAILIGFGSSFAVPSVQAESTDDLKNKQTQIQEERSEVQDAIHKKDQKISNVQSEIEELNEQIQRVDQAVKDNKNKIEETKENIANTKSDIKETEEEIATLEKSIEERYEILKERAISFQKSGGNISYLEVIMGAESFGDFISRISATSKIAEADSDLLEEQEADKAELEEKKASVEKRLDELNDSKTKLQGMQAQIEEQQQQNKGLKKQLKEKKQNAEESKAELESENNNLASQESEIAQNIEDGENSQRNVNTQSTENSGESNDGSSNSSKKVSNTTKSSIPSGNSNDVVKAGHKYIGNSVYVFGGGRTASDIANGRFDCSGFVHWAFSQAGINVSSSTDGLKNDGHQVSASEKQPGDLVFFDTYKQDGHVGIYAGGGKFIGSQSSTGVAVENMSSGYWADKFNGRVVRVMN